MLALLCGAQMAFAASPEPSLAVPAGQTQLGLDVQGTLRAPGLGQIGDLLVLSPGAAWYPEAAAATGAQGLAVVLMDLAPDGRVLKTEIAYSSHASVLDQQARRLASQLHWMGARKMPARVSLRVLFARDSMQSVSEKTCAELNLDVAWLKSHDRAQPPEHVGAMNVLRGMVLFGTNWMPDQRDRDAGRALRDAMLLASRRTIGECAKHPEGRMQEVFDRHLREVAGTREHAPPAPRAALDMGKLPRSILHTPSDDVVYGDGILVHASDAAYPSSSLAAGHQGDVEVRAELDDAGEVEQVVLHQDHSGSSELINAALDVVRGRLAKGYVGKTGDDGHVPPAIVMRVFFSRHDTDSIASLDCATYRLDAAAWGGERRRLPDYETLNSVLFRRAVQAQEEGPRRPRRDTFGEFKEKDHLTTMQALDEACDAAPRKLAIDALIDLLDAMPATR